MAALSRIGSAALWVAVAASLLAVAPALADAQGTAWGLTYTMHVTSVVHSDESGAVPSDPRKSEWTGNVAFSTGRGRLDVVEGAEVSLFAKGDYLLFDSTEFIVVHPDAKAFVSVPSNMVNRAMQMAQSGGINMTFKDVKASLDSLGPSDTVAERPTRHYRLNVEYTLSLDLSGMAIDLSGIVPPAVTTHMTTDYWIANLNAFPPNPLAKLMNDAASMSMMKDVRDKITAAVAAMPPGVALRTTTTSRASDPSKPSGALAGTDHAMAIADIKAAYVELSRLVLPDGYTETPFPGMELLVVDSAAPRPDHGAKWRARPGGESP